MKVTSVLALLLFVSGIVFAQPGTRVINVYFHNEKFNPNAEDCRKVYPTPRRVPATKAIAKAALLELFKGTTPEERAKEFSSFDPDSTANILKNINIKSGIAYVNFNDVVYEKLGVATTSCGGSSFFSSVEKTLKQFPTIKKVVYAVEGNTNEFYEWVQVGECPHGKMQCAASNFR